jgi:predicted DCC family thiol-disulfide oxidoreductase YuxK
MKSLVSLLDRFWFAPMPPARLAILRIASGLFTLWYLLSRYELISDTVRGDRDMFAPVGLAAWLSEPLAPAFFMGIYWATVVLNLAYLLGWKFRYTALLFAAANLFVFSYRYSWSMIYHDNIAVVLHVLVIALGPSADALSWDARRKAGAEAAHWRYGWPVQLLCAATLLTYFLSGVAKVYGDLAWAWVDGSAMRSQVAVDSMRKILMGDSATPFFEWIYPQTWLFLLMGLGTMVIELGAPLVMLSRRLGVAWSVLTWLLHIGIFVVMGITFRYQMLGLIFLPFLDVEKFWPWVKHRLSKFWKLEKPGNSESPAIALFDGVCNFCNGTVRFVARRDPQGRVHFASQQSAQGQALLVRHGVSSELSSIVFIENGRVFQKSTAVLRMLRHLRVPWPVLSVLLWVPASLRDGVYDWVARNRYAWFGKSEVCPMPPADIRARFL